MSAYLRAHPGMEVSFQWKDPDFLFRNPDFLLKNVDSIIKQVLELHTQFQAPPILVWSCVAAIFMMPLGKNTGHYLWSTRAMLWRTVGRVLAGEFCNEIDEFL